MTIYLCERNEIHDLYVFSKFLPAFLTKWYAWRWLNTSAETSSHFVQSAMCWREFIPIWDTTGMNSLRVTNVSERYCRRQSHQLFPSKFLSHFLLTWHNFNKVRSQFVQLVVLAPQVTVRLTSQHLRRCQGNIFRVVTKRTVNDVTKR